MAHVEKLKGTSPFGRLISSLDVPEMLDCTFIVGEEKQQIKASKILLSSVSEVFERIFFGEMSTNDPIEIPDVEPCIFKKFLRICIYMLTDRRHNFGEDALSREDALKIFPLADMYMINSLIKLLIDILRPKSANDFYENLRLASCFYVEELMVSNIDFLSTRANILDDNLFLATSSPIVVSIFKAKYFEVYSEVQLFYTAMKWASFQCRKRSISDDCSNLRKILEEEGILKHIRFLSMSLDDFMNGPYKSGVLTEKESTAIIYNIKRCDDTQKVSLPDTLSHLRNGRWEKYWLFHHTWKTADIFLFSDNFEKKSQYKSKFLILKMREFERSYLCGVTLSPRPSRHPSEGEYYDENVTVSAFYMYDFEGTNLISLCSGEYKGKVRFDTSVYVSFNIETCNKRTEKLLFKVNYMNEEWHKYCLPSSSINNGVFKHMEGPNTIMKIHYGEIENLSPE